MSSSAETTASLRIVLATFGTHGDLNPFIGIARALREMGLDPVIATHEEYREPVQSAGVAFHPVRPHRRQLGMDSVAKTTEMLRAFRQRPQLILTRFVLPHLEESYEDVLTAMTGARLVFSSSLSFGAKLAAEKLGIPHIAVVLQPSMMLSAYDPPVLGTHIGMSRVLYAGGPVVNRILLGLARRISRRWVQPVDRFRARLGLPDAPHPFFEGQWRGAQWILGLYSSVLGTRQADHPRHFSVAGFSFYDGVGELSPDIRQFLDEGSPPLIFTLGTSAVHDSSRFVTVAVDALRILQERALLVLDEAQCAAWRTKLPDNVRITGYVPYSLIFPRARAIIHHGGIGTTAQALRAGRPQLVAPYFVDQPDNAKRVARLGGAVLPLDRWSPLRLVAALKALTGDPMITARARHVALDMANEQGADAAAHLAMQLLSSPTQFTDLPVPSQTPPL